MKRKPLFVSLSSLILLLIAGIAFARQPDPLFTLERQFGELRPQGIQYDPNFDRFAWVERAGQLVLVDAATLATQHTLYESGAYNAYQFSHNGRMLALAIDRRIELWDTATGTRLAQLEPPAANLVQGRLVFTPDDTWLLFDTVVPAPQETRRSENDTSIIPYLWDIPDALNSARSRLDSGEQFYPFFNFRNGLIVGANTYLIAGIPNRLQVIDGGNNDFPVIADIRANRLERDPISVWRSATDDLLYVDPADGYRLPQINTRTGAAYEIALGRDLSYGSFAQIAGMSFADNARVLCGTNLRRETSLLRLILGDGYLRYQNYAPLTVMLLDLLEPMTMDEERGGLLIYTFNEAAGRGVIELIRPQSIQQMRLSPDRAHLLIRRAEGRQPLEIYNLETCVLERTIYPVERDSGGSQLLAYNATGTVILSDFQRFDAATGAELARADRFTTSYGEFLFSGDSQSLITLDQGVWRARDITTGQVREELPLAIQGDVLRRSPDATAYLTRIDLTDGTEIAIEDARGGTRRTLFIPREANLQIAALTPSPDWEKLLVVYTNGEIAVYQFGRGRLLFVTTPDLPLQSTYGWLDDRTIYARGNSFNQGDHLVGLDYHPSGLPQCLVAAFPDDWSRWTVTWEGLTLALTTDQLERLTERLCAALPTDANQVIPALTPTARPFYYAADSTPVPYAIPDVPVCLTRAFPGEALDYAALWRQMTADLSSEQSAELEAMLCEGLIRSIGGIAPTPTINPNMMAPPTATPAQAAPITVERATSARAAVMTIDIETGQRAAGDYLPPSAATAPEHNLGLIRNLFVSQFRAEPTGLVLSPDGWRIAARDVNGFIQVYRLNRSYADLLQDEMNAAATRDAAQGRSIGLQPSPTQPFSAVGGLNPTLTPTITTTPIPLANATAEGWQFEHVEEICPAPRLYTLDAPPPDFAPPGRLFISPTTGAGGMTWVLQPRNGELHPDDTIPTCWLRGGCAASASGRWLVDTSHGVIVSRADGSNPTTLYQPEERAYFPTNYRWIGEVLEYTYSDYIPTQRDPVTLIRRYDPATGALSEPFMPPPPIRYENLPVTLVSEQPLGGTLALISTPYGNGGRKYYIYDRATSTASYFIRVERGELRAEWHPFGRALYYWDQNDWYAFDAITHEHHLLGNVGVSGVWSPDGRYRAGWAVITQPDYARWIPEQRLPLRLRLWDSETGAFRLYCIPESGFYGVFDAPLYWSPDSRYLALTLTLPVEGDVIPPVATPTEPPPTATSIPLETLYQYQFPRALILDTRTGSVTVISAEVTDIFAWLEDTP